MLAGGRSLLNHNDAKDDHDNMQEIEIMDFVTLDFSFLHHFFHFFITFFRSFSSLFPNLFPQHRNMLHKNNSRKLGSHSPRPRFPRSFRAAQRHSHKWAISRLECYWDHPAWVWSPEEIADFPCDHVLRDRIHGRRIYCLHQVFSGCDERGQFNFGQSCGVEFRAGSGFMIHGNT